MKDIQPLLSQLGFATTHAVTGLPSIDTLIPEKQRCGIYVLHFDDGRYYVGQSVNVADRYKQHLRTYAKIDRLSFKQVAKTKTALDNAEIDSIRRVEADGFPLLNIVHASLTWRSSEFDLIMLPDDQKRWLDGNYQEPVSTYRVSDSDDLRAKKHALYKNRFLTTRDARDVIRVLRTYAKIGIPAMRQSEVSHWCCSCLPQSPVYTRVNIYWQEVFTAFKRQTGLTFAIHMARSQLSAGSLLAQLFERLPRLNLKKASTDEGDQNIGGSIIEILTTDPFLQVSETHTKQLKAALDALFTKFPSLEIDDHAYDPGGQDQLCIRIEGAEAALRLFQEPDFQRAIRFFNLNLMRKGTNIYGRNHCFDLADELYK